MNIEPKPLFYLTFMLPDFFGRFRRYALQCLPRLSGFPIPTQGRQYSRSRRNASSRSSRSRSEVAVSRPWMPSLIRGQGGPGSPKSLPMNPTTRAGVSGSRIRKDSGRSPPGNSARRLRNGLLAKEGTGVCWRAHSRPCSSSSPAVAVDAAAGSGSAPLEAISSGGRSDRAGRIRNPGRGAGGGGGGGRAEGWTMRSTKTKRMRVSSDCLPPMCWCKPSNQNRPACTTTTHAHAMTCVVRPCSFDRIQTPRI